MVNLFDGKVVTRVGLDNYPAEKLQGNIAMVSHGGKATERRYWFRDFSAQGEGIDVHPDRHFGPILGVIYSLDETRLKLNAQFPPLGFNDSREAVLEFREGDQWRLVETSWERVDTSVWLHRSFRYFNGSCLGRLRLPGWLFLG